MYKMQVLVTEGKRKVWRDVHPTGGPAYVYATEREAQEMRRICYSDSVAELTRVVSADTPEGDN